MPRAKRIEASQEVETPFGGDAAVRLVTIMAQGSEQLLKLQSGYAVSTLTEQFRQIEAPVTPDAAMAAMWRLPTIYSAMFEHLAEHARQSCRIMLQMQNALVDLACDSVAAQAPLIAQAIVDGNVAFVDRRSSSTVINFPDRRGMIACSSQRN